MTEDRKPRTIEQTPTAAETSKVRSVRYDPHFGTTDDFAPASGDGEFRDRNECDF